MAESKRRVRYVGPHAAVEVEDEDGTLHRVEQGGEKTMPKSVADSLLEQRENWQPAKSKGDD